MKTQVLIVGAGPTGLMMACQLQRLGIDFIIIDDKATTTDRSKALAVHARSVEIFRQLGIVGNALERGSIAKAVNVVVKDKVSGHVPFGHFGADLSPYPYVLMLEQSKNEQLLEEYLAAEHHSVLWQHELVNFTRNASNIVATVRNPVGDEIKIDALYMVAADGAKSPVRHLLGIPFLGQTYEHLFFVADTKMDWKLKTDEIYILFSTRTFSALFPMVGEGRFRLIGTLPARYSEDDQVSFGDIEETIRSQMDIPVRFSDTSWFSLYRVHHRVVDSFRNGRVFLAGDSAHVHSPVGAQGMNTGLQDSWNLAWKLAWVLKGISDEQLLDSYNEERHKIALTLVKSTDRLFTVVTNPSIWAKLIRYYLIPLVAPLLTSFGPFKTKLFKMVSQIAIKYPTSSLSFGKAGKIKAGTRFPYFKFIDAEGARIESFDFFTQTGICIITCNIESIYLNIPGLQVRHHSIPSTNGNIATLKKIGLSDRFICIVRPDTYIGYISNVYNPEKIESYLHTGLHITEASCAY